MNDVTWPISPSDALEEEVASIQAKLDSSEGESIKIQQQLDRTDRRAPDFDRDWYARAIASLSYRRRDEQRMRERISALRRQIRTARDDAFKKCLIGAMRRAVGEERFRAIWSEAMEEWARITPPRT